MFFQVHVEGIAAFKDGKSKTLIKALSVSNVMMKIQMQAKDMVIVI